ncbi:MAG: M23 family metallopeptidase, partial [Gemmatimonadetes bacterium]|nr:M23 family metallopeptidase [Gemmatimonadota bacterium]
MNAYRAMGLVLLCGFGFGAFSMVLPREPHGARENAPLLEAVYAAPAERVDTHVLRGGENLTKVLGRSGITGTELWDLLLALREHKDPRWLVSGTEVTVRRWAATDELRSIDVRVNADSTVRLARSIIGWSGDLVLAAIYVDTVYIAGTIEAGRTLYEAIAMDDELTLSARERAQVVAQLANDIYAYRLDFSHDIRPGDRYRLVYERERREDGSTRRRRILIAEIENQGRTYSAVHFDLGKAGGGYYDRDGQSLWLAFRRSPLEFSRVTSSFSWNRYHPLLGIYRAHLGTDFGAAYGTPVHATGDGTVAFAARDGGYGNVVVLHHPGGYSTRYAHLGRFAA